jgi:alkanesulfonate monooxygenase SsuD/methylene tetrahydromethanopterin reductase-like flavin-dependent oxidoreductase (luciferase family)
MAGDLRVGVHTGVQDCTFDELRSLWRDIEAAGFDWISVWDHFYPANTASEGPCFEAVASHAALGAYTQRVRVGCLVYAAGYRNPAVLANAAVTIDHISGGRLELGLGAGWLHPEAEAYGINFGPAATRIRQLEEAVTIVRSLWSQDVTDFDGEFWTLRQARCNPKPVQERPRIWIGGWGEKRMLPLVGRIADGWNAAFLSTVDWARKAGIVRESAAAAGREPGAVTLSANVGLAIGRNDADVARKRAGLTTQFGGLATYLEPGILLGTPARALEHCMGYVDAGAEWIILAVRAPFDRDSLDLFCAQVLPELRR